MMHTSAGDRFCAQQPKAVPGRRSFLGAALAILGAGATPRMAQARERRLLIQNSPLAGFQYHAGESIWGLLESGAPPSLVREPRNPFDPRAVRVVWQGHVLGYVPQNENAAIAQLLDRDEVLHAHITKLKQSRNPWGRISFAVEARVE